jgi:MSHA biogenesis protein MshO
MRRDTPRGFTLVELVLVIVIGGIVAATLAVFLRPAFDTWLAVRVRGDLAHQAATALRLMRDDVRVAVPNSIRTPGSQCFELVPTSSGGRFRQADDTVNPGSMPLDVTTTTTQFDVLSTLAATPAVGDWVVIDNQNPGDVYSGSNRAQVSAVSTPDPSLGQHRLTVAATQFPTGYAGARMVVVPNTQRALFYVCSGADGTLDASGNGRGTLVRLSNYGFNAAYPAACPSTAGGAVLATNVRSCRFVYDPNQGATQQNGFVSMQVELARDNETASLVIGAHVANVP